MTATAKIILDSVSPDGVRLTTMEVVMHRFVLAEFNTHRAFSRNSASSRAIPFEARLHDFQSRPAMPLSWPREQPGMQGGEELEGDELNDAQETIRAIHDEVGMLLDKYIARHPMKRFRLHKSVLNRYLEPFLWHTVVVSSTEWENFFEQRCSPLAQPEIRAAAEAMRQAYRESTPQVVPYTGWHLPYVTELDYQLQDTEDPRLRKLSVARCARVSYLTQDGRRDWAEDFRLYDRLVSATPPHWSPLEHVARPTPLARSEGNFEGWEQLRHLPEFQ